RPVAGDDLRGQVWVPERPVRRAGHEPEQHEVEQDDRRDGDDRLEQLPPEVASAHCARMVSVANEGRRSGPQLTLGSSSPCLGYSSSMAFVERLRKYHQPPMTTIATSTSTISNDGLTPWPEVPPVLGPWVAGGAVGPSVAVGPGVGTAVTSVSSV